MTDRDTKFLGFAELVAQELREQDLLFIGNHVKPLVEPPIDVDYEHIKRIIARRAYDLAVHVLANQPIIPRNTFPDDSEVIRKIPDLTQWPESPDSE